MFRFPDLGKDIGKSGNIFSEIWEIFPDQGWVHVSDLADGIT